MQKFYKLDDQIQSIEKLWSKVPETVINFKTILLISILILKRITNAKELAYKMII